MIKIVSLIEKLFDECVNVLDGLVLFVGLGVFFFLLTCIFAPIIAVSLIPILCAMPKYSKIKDKRNIVLQFWGASIFFSTGWIIFVGFNYISVIVVGTIGVLIFLISRYYPKIKKIFEKKIAPDII